ncbi:MAG: hypothetical protein ABSG05_00880 [Candidatus Pacearchaeota archaeon]|jgi:hypothetical protein
MELKVKKRNGHEVHRVNGTAEIKEVLGSADLFEQKNQIVQVCFRGEHCSGIFELSGDEAKGLSKELNRVTKAGNKFKIMKLRE